MNGVNTHYIFVVGGVLSGLGKGIFTSSLGLLLKSCGYSTVAIKIDPYVNLDAGTMRPTEHGEIFVTDDGGETDQDIGHYERFINVDLTRMHNITTGQIYSEIIARERQLGYGGRDVEMFPDVINEAKRRILLFDGQYDFVIVEVGGTTGDVENLPFLHAAREIRTIKPAIYIMVSYLPFLKNVGELKTKPTQHAVAALRSIGILPDFLICRSEFATDRPRRETLSRRCFIPPENILDDPDVENIYEVPLVLRSQDVTTKVLKQFGLPDRPPQIDEWRKFIDSLRFGSPTVHVGLVEKYSQHGKREHRDVHLSVLEAIRHASAAAGLCAQVSQVSSEEVSYDTSVLEKFDGLIVPQGWGGRGIEGKISAARFSRERGVPYLGLCYGMQIAVVEVAKDVCGLEGANSIEADPTTPHPVIHIMPDQERIIAEKQYGGTIRLGAYPCLLVPGTRTQQIYGVDKIEERHRHRYEFNSDYRQCLEEKGLRVAGTSPDGRVVEIVELADHPFFIGTQFHPELKSRPLSPHPLFVAFLKACAEHRG